MMQPRRSLRRLRGNQLMDYNTLLLFILTETLLSITPGPAVLLVIGLALRNGFKISFAAALGIIATNAVYFTLAALGVGAAILASATLFTIIKWVGAAYLVYLGLQMLVPFIKGFMHSNNKSAIDIEDAKSAAKKVQQTPQKAFAKGFVLQASNPKNIAFFVAILPQFISPDGNVALQLTILGICSVLLELPILIFYGLVSAKSATLMKERFVEWLEGIAGGILIALGGALAFLERRTN